MLRNHSSVAATVWLMMRWHSGRNSGSRIVTMRSSWTRMASGTGSATMYGRPIDSNSVEYSTMPRVDIATRSPASETSAR